MVESYAERLTPPSPKENYLLAGLPESHRLPFVQKLSVIFLPRGEVLYESGDEEEFVYFPTSAIISLLHMMKDGSSVEVSVVGNEGIVGVDVFMGGCRTQSRVVVQSAGFAYRLSAAALKNEFNHHGPLMTLLLNYTQSLITQMAQTSACNRYHSIDQQLCRLLLLSLDRLNKNTLTMTQEIIASMLGVRREGVTAAAGKLQKRGVIKYARGHITIMNRPELEHLSCECYALVKNEARRLQPFFRN